MAGMIKNFQDKAANKAPVDNGETSTLVKGYWEQTSRENSALTTIADLKLQGNPQTLTAPNMCPKSDSPLATGAKWDHANVNVAFFTKTAYRGAFGPTETAANNWMTGWTNFDPQNTVY